MSNQSTAIALVEFGYQTYAVPIQLIEQLAQLRRVAKEYVSGSGYRYWYEEERPEFNVTIMASASVLAAKPADPEPAPAPAVAPKSPDLRVVAAPSDEPIVIGKVPPMREFVDEYRHEDSEPSTDAPAQDATQPSEQDQ